MFSAYVRGALNVGAAVLVGAILQFIVPYLLPYQGDSDSLLYSSFEAISENAILIMLVAVGFTLIVQASIERNPRGL